MDDLQLPNDPDFTVDDSIRLVTDPDPKSANTFILRVGAMRKPYRVS